jgi:hypothetical protein
MPTTKPIAVKELILDLNNFRTVPQSNETDAIKAMISIAPDRFWALAESLLDGGYLPTENIIVLKTTKGMIVKEGNRRIGALKLIFGDIKRHGMNVPENVETKIKIVSTEWKSKNTQVSCAIYDSAEEDVVDKIVTLAHGKGEQASRDNWTSVARARHNRDKNNVSEPALDLLEKYLENGKNLTVEQRDRWGGDYPLTVLDDTIKRIASRLDCSTAKEVAEKYPSKTKFRAELEKILLDVGLKTLVFEIIRNKNEDFAQVKYGLPAPPPPAPLVVVVPTAPKPNTVASARSQVVSVVVNKPTALATNDPKAVIQALKKFTPRGNDRNKVVTLLGSSASAVASRV